MAKPTGAACNLDCTYCFFLSKELLHDRDSQQMSEATLERYIADFLGSQPDGDVTLEWQGGEPTMRGLPFFRRAVEIAEQYRWPAQSVRHSLQTNGTLIDDQWARFLAGNGFLVGLSMDGPAEDHDAYRVNRAGRPTHDQVLRGWKILQAHGVQTNILCTVHAANADHPLEVYRYFRDELGATYLQFIPIVERTSRKLLPLADAGWHEPGEARPFYTQKGRHVTERSVGPEQWGRFMSTIWDEWVVRDVGRVYVQHFDTALGNAMGQYSMCVHSPTCGDAVAVLHNGDVYACDHYVEPDYVRGNIAEVSLRDVLDSTEQRQFGTDKATTLSQQCQDCPVKWACWGGCPKDRFVPVDGGRHQQNYLCAGYFEFFSHITPDIARMTQLIRMGRPAAAIMKLPTTRR
ncbi:putative arylsulfatase regulator [Acidipropionibacterium acidipropionici ATCC 4875]|uniref:Putative arylsulfatase regulator n=1 Tax=Acidipropionibacterium acidipropionici (strain ATCC 4875 / DSM 20272 / JCM 6432 / NBRC 12425 / NCIMB 8070 / 4) TaxID=1171373 RepID=K7RPF5_ACIA4|nr:anaerobic sulfatase maturase [Acidipropionibacterium acidipropionici]AFV88206.1 putative arylsulfatase regulator [Acidipropionibacterium acidipropionici ATCC 4875]